MASIVKRKKKYSVVYTYTDENGNKRQKWETFDTEAERRRYFCFWGCKMDRAFMDEYYDKMRADDIEELSSQRNEDYSDRADDYKAAKQALLEGLGLSHLFSGNRKLTPEEKELWLLFDRVYVTELLARDEFAKGAYMLGAEDRETMLR